MSDYISREKYLQDVEHYKNQICYMSNVSMDDCIKICNEQPSADVRENIKGEWIAQDIHNCHTNFMCSECGYIHSFMHLYGKPTADYTYCPNCGADMRGDT